MQSFKSSRPEFDVRSAGLRAMLALRRICWPRAADVVITHPNAVNASDINEMASNVLYVEGKSLDDFLLGHLGLAPTRSNRIGTFVDPTGEAYLDDVIHTLNAARAVGGIDCSLYTLGSRGNRRAYGLVPERLCGRNRAQSAGHS